MVNNFCQGRRPALLTFLSILDGVFPMFLIYIFYIDTENKEYRSFTLRFRSPQLVGELSYPLIGNLRAA